MFGHEKFEAYQISIKFLALALNVNEQLPRAFYCSNTFKNLSESHE